MLTQGPLGELRNELRVLDFLSTSVYQCLWTRAPKQGLNKQFGSGPKKAVSVKTAFQQCLSEQRWPISQDVAQRLAATQHI